MKNRPIVTLLFAAITVITVIQAQDARPGAQPNDRAEGERGGMQQQRREPLFAALDANGDGVIDDKELTNAVVALKKLDKNGDGKITQDEVRPSIPQRGGPGQVGSNADEMVTRLLQFDKNGDGKLSKDELPERMQSMLQRGDANKDGFLDKDEIRKVAQSQQAVPPVGREGRERD